MYFALVAIVTLLVIFIVKWKVSVYKFSQHLKKFPGPKPLPLLGNALLFAGGGTEILPTFLKLTEEYGDVVKITLGPNIPILLVKDYKFLEFVLTSNNILQKSADYNAFHSWLGTGLLTATGTKWRQHRKILTPAFHFQILEQFIEVFNTATAVLVDKLNNEIDAESVDIYPYITLCALDIICESTMGISINAQGSSDSNYVHSVKEMCRILTVRGFSIFKQSDFLYRLSFDYQREKSALKILHDHTKLVISRRKNELKQNINLVKLDDKKKKLPLLDVLLLSTIDGKPLSNDDIREEVDTFMFEGHDTTASAMSFTLFCLSKHPEIQEKVLQELKRLGLDDLERGVTYRDLQDMKYLELVIKESLRLYPSVPLYARDLSEDVEYDGGILPKDLTIAIFAYGIQRDPKYFPEPEKFDPERFTSDNFTGQNPFCYLPFSAGPRNCIGQKFAMLEMKAAVSKVLRHFKLLPANPKDEPILCSEVVLKSANGIKMRLQKRII